LRHAKDFIPNLIEFKLSTVLHGSNSVAKPVFADSPAIGQAYVPKRLKLIMTKLESGEIAEDEEPGDGSHESGLAEDDY